MTCPKNPQKRWGLFPYEGVHQTILIRLERGPDVYIVYFKCSLCGSVLPEVWNEPDMVRNGFDVDALREIDPDKGVRKFEPEEFLPHRTGGDWSMNYEVIVTHLIAVLGDDKMRELGWQRVRVYTAEEQEEIDRIMTQMPEFKDPSMDVLREILKKQHEKEKTP